MMAGRASFVVGLLIVVLGVLGCPQKAQPPAGTEVPGQPATSGAPPVKVAPGGVLLGEMIFTKGVGASGHHVAFTKGSDRFNAQPGGCANCHGPDGMGKRVSDKVTFPPIRYCDLCMPMDGKPAMYDENALRKAIVLGVNEEGNPLDDIMPRWQLTDVEFAALVDYLKALDTKPPAAPKAGAPGPKAK